MAILVDVTSFHQIPGRVIPSVVVDLFIIIWVDSEASLGQVDCRSLDPDKWHVRYRLSDVSAVGTSDSSGDHIVMPVFGSSIHLLDCVSYMRGGWSK